MIVMENYVSTINTNDEVDSDAVWKQYFKVSEFVNQKAKDLLPVCLEKYESSDAHDNVPHSNTYINAYNRSEKKWQGFQKSIDSYNKHKDELSTKPETESDTSALVNAMQTCQDQWLEAIMGHIQMEAVSINERKEICKLLLYKPEYRQQQSGASIPLSESIFEKMSWRHRLGTNDQRYSNFLTAQKELIFLCVNNQTLILTADTNKTSIADLIKEDLIKKFTTNNDISNGYNIFKATYLKMKRLKPNEASNTDTQTFTVDWLTSIIRTWIIMKKTIEGKNSFTNKTIQDAATAQANSLPSRHAMYAASISKQILVQHITREEVRDIIRFADLSKDFWNNKLKFSKMPWKDWKNGISFSRCEVKYEAVKKKNEKIFAENFVLHSESIIKKKKKNKSLFEAISQNVTAYRPKIIGYCVNMQQLIENKRLFIVSSD